MTRFETRPKVLYLCDWLPPDFGSVGQYSLLFARQRAAAGADVRLVGLTSGKESLVEEQTEAGRLKILRIPARVYDRARLLERAWWTARTNFRLIWRIRKAMGWADEIIFTGSPPFLVHLLTPLNQWFYHKRLIYHITDFHPECLMATLNPVPLPLRALYRLTLFWRRRVSAFEALGEDQRRRLQEIGIPAERIVIRRYPPPVAFTGQETPLATPAALAGKRVLLYAGNWGVAHDVDTFCEGFRRYHAQGGGAFGLWLNAIGASADSVEQRLRAAGLPIHRSRPGPLAELANLLVTPDAHLITLRDEFVGFVLPSKVFACIASGRPILYIGSRDSDLHLLCAQALAPSHYRQVAVGDPAGVVAALEHLATLAAGAQERRVSS